MWIGGLLGQRIPSVQFSGALEHRHLSYDLPKMIATSNSLEGSACGLQKLMGEGAGKKDCCCHSGRSIRGRKMATEEGAGNSSRVAPSFGAVSFLLPFLFINS